MKRDRKKFEGNVMIAISALKHIMTIFLGPFLTAYFIKTSREGMTDLSIYYITSFALLAIGAFLVANIVKRKFRIGMFRIGVVLDFLYILTIIILNKNIVDHLLFVSILYGISMSVYWFPHDLFIVNKVDSSYRTEYTVKNKIVITLVSVLCPLLLGSIITVTNYILTAVIVLFVALAQIVLSFFLSPDEEANLPKFNLVKTWKKLKGSGQIRKILAAEFLIGMNINDGALNVLMTILVFNSFKTDMNLGIINSAIAILSALFVFLYGKFFKDKNDKKAIVFSSIIPVLSVILVLALKCDASIVIYSACFTIFTTILAVAREIRIFNAANSKIVGKDNQVEFFAIRECMLNCGRIFGYSLLLLAGICGNETVLNVVMIVLTLSIFTMGMLIKKIEKFES